MKKITSVLLKCFAAVILISSCKKNQSDENYQETEEPVIPVFTEKINTTVSGFIIDEEERPVGGAQVNAGTLSATTDEYGYFKISNASLTKNIGLVKVSKIGFFTGFKTFIAKAGEQHFFRMMLLTKSSSGNFSATAGGTVTTADGASVTIPVNGVVDAVSGATYSGAVYVSAKVLPVTAMDSKLYSIPGDARGLNADGHLQSLNTHASIAVDLNGDAGQKLQLANNVKATISLPVAASLQSKAPATVALWSLDEEKGVWKEEGTLTKTGNNYSGQVSHFSYWSGASGLSLVNFTAQVLTTSLQPLSNVPVVITLAGQPLNAGYGKFAFTDANGIVSGALPANSSFVLNVMTTCSINAYNHNFSTTTSNIDLGAITGNLGQATVTLSATINKCNGQPVTNGYVQTYDHGFYNRIPITNGSIHFTGVMCDNQPVNYIAVDNETNLQSSPQSINLQPGNNNLGVINACGVNTYGSATYIIDGVTRTLQEPAVRLWAFFDAASGTTAIARIPDTSGGSDFTFQFNGGTSLGNNHKVSDIWSIGYPSGRGYAPVPLDVTITEFGDIGGFISGSFSGIVQDFTNGTLHNIQYNFRIKRVN